MKGKFLDDDHKIFRSEHKMSLLMERSNKMGVVKKFHEAQRGEGINAEIHIQLHKDTLIPNSNNVNVENVGWLVICTFEFNNGKEFNISTAFCDNGN